MCCKDKDFTLKCKHFLSFFCQPPIISIKTVIKKQCKETLFQFSPLKRGSQRGINFIKKQNFICVVHPLLTSPFPLDLWSLVPNLLGLKKGRNCLMGILNYLYYI